jgi:ATP-dependent Clp protease ATP-binding subunit ClpX
MAGKSRNRNAFCSFCRKSYLHAGPLVEGPGDVYICGECSELCQSIIDQERRRRRLADVVFPPAAEAIEASLNQLVSGQEKAVRTLALVAHRHYQQSDDRTPHILAHVLLIGPSPSTRRLLAQALAHVLEVPFAEENLDGVVKPNEGSIEAAPFYKLSWFT